METAVKNKYSFEHANTKFAACTTPKKAAQAYKQHHTDVNDDDDVSLMCWADCDGGKMWAVVPSDWAINCKFGDVKDASSWWDDDCSKSTKDNDERHVLQNTEFFY